ncbi:MAG: helix-turn-helix transcriptional regulator [Candidatus Omnitrophica bacterium]|nr:helix-turn-helix transcriptional regulator [Candidatus Omnitrophota bacterium]
MYIGAKVRAIRKSKNMSLKELAEKSKLQIATLCRMEQCKMRGTVDSHLRIAKSLDMSITDLYQSVLQEEELKKTSAAAHSVFASNTKVNFQILSKNITNKKLLPLLISIEKGGKTTEERGPIGAEKFIYVLNGEIQIDIAGEILQLSKSNSIHFEASKPHFIKNLKDTASQYLSIMTPSNI